MEIRETIDAYVKAFTAGDREAWLALWAPDATMEDPVGTPVKRGHDEIGAFFDESRRMAESELRVGEVLVACGNEAAWVLEIRVELGGTVMGMNAIDVMRFDDDGRIRSQRAFVDLTQLAPPAT